MKIVITFVILMAIAGMVALSFAQRTNYGQEAENMNNTTQQRDFDKKPSDTATAVFAMG